MGDFVKSKRSMLESSLAHEKSTIVRLCKVAEEIASLATRTSSLDRAKEIDEFKKQMISGLQHDVSDSIYFGN